MVDSDNKWRFDVPVFTGYIEPNGWLTDEPATHACFYYYLCARRTYEEVELDPVVYEDDKDPEFNYQQLWTSIAKMYNVEVGQMAQCWNAVDNQCDLLDLPRLPEGERYRHDAPIIITES